MALVYVNFEFREPSSADAVRKLVQKYIDDKNLFMDKPKTVAGIQPYDRCLASVVSDVVDQFVAEMERIPLTAVKAHKPGN